MMLRTKNKPKVHCLICDTVLEGRADRKFCSDKCKNDYNNDKNSIDSKYIKKVNRVLNKNRIILKEFLEESNKKVTREDMIVKGFNFKYFTNLYISKSKQEYKYCYDYGYLELNPNSYLVVKKK